MEFLGLVVLVYLHRMPAWAWIRWSGLKVSWTSRWVGNRHVGTQSSGANVKPGAYEPCDSYPMQGNLKPNGITGRSKTGWGQWWFSGCCFLSLFKKKGSRSIALPAFSLWNGDGFWLGATFPPCTFGTHPFHVCAFNHSCWVPDTCFAIHWLFILITYLE